MKSFSSLVRSPLGSHSLLHAWQDGAHYCTSIILYPARLCSDSICLISHQKESALGVRDGPRGQRPQKER